MIAFNNGGTLCDELPWHLVGARDVFLDFETSSHDAKKKSTNPWFDCWVAGIAVTVDDHPRAYYVPHTLPCWDEWLFAMLDGCKRWINHNVKYDAHVAANCGGVIYGGADSGQSLVCTLTLSKIIDSDRIAKGGYALDELASAWLGEDISQYEAKLQPYLHKNKDYGRIPPDILGEYACQDVLTTRRLWKFLDARCPEQCRGVWNTEIELTSVLFEMERTGLRVDPVQLQQKELELLMRLLIVEEQLAATTGRVFRPHVNEDCYDVLCNQYGLPVLGWTESRPPSPSFDKNALKQYLAHPLAPRDVVKSMLEYRIENTLKNFFVQPYQQLSIPEADGRYAVMHSSYNQAVRTGRLSCKQPNSQQLNKQAKELIIPGEGMAFLSVDYSQIEFRLIAHYINNPQWITAYNNNPDTDAHDWVAKMCDIHRKPAKTVNFCIGFGGGKSRVLSMLEANMELVGSLIKQVDELVLQGKVQEKDRIAVFHLLARRRAEQVYETYHRTLPELKRTSYAAANACKMKGYVYNLYGRHRHLPFDHAHKAFNNLNQSSAADLMKERTVEVSKLLKNSPIKIVASVHDETLFWGPTELLKQPSVQHRILACMESPTVNLRVPIRCTIGFSGENWREASESAALVAYNREKNLTSDEKFL